MNSVAQAAPYVLSLGGAAFVTALIIQCLVKPVLNFVIAPTNPNQNAVVRGAVYVVALIVVLASQFLHYQLNTRSDLAAALGTGFVVAGLAIASYHVLTSDELPTLTAIQGKAIELPKPATLPVNAGLDSAPLAPATPDPAPVPAAQ